MGVKQLYFFYFFLFFVYFFNMFSENKYSGKLFTWWYEHLDLSIMLVYIHVTFKHNRYFLRLKSRYMYTTYV